MAAMNKEISINNIIMQNAFFQLCITFFLALGPFQPHMDNIVVCMPSPPSRQRKNDHEEIGCCIQNIAAETQAAMRFNSPCQQNAEASSFYVLLLIKDRQQGLLPHRS